MPEIQELDLHQVSAAPDIIVDRSSDAAQQSLDDSDRVKWIILGVLAVVAVTVIAYVVGQRRTASPAPAPVASAAAAPTAAAPPKTAGPLVEAEQIPLPPLPETDALVRALVVKLTSHPKALAWLATDGLIANFTVSTLNLSDGQTPVIHLRRLAPQARFSVLKTDRGFVVDPKSYRRYDEFAAAVSGLDAAGTARLYLTLKPRITDAYRELGYPEGDFDRVLESAIKQLLSTPAVDNNAVLREKVVSYQFVDPAIESLTAAQKQLLRMGPENMRRVQDKLREIATQLGLHF